MISSLDQFMCVTSTIQNPQSSSGSGGQSVDAMMPRFPVQIYTSAGNIAHTWYLLLRRLSQLSPSLIIIHSFTSPKALLLADRKMLSPSSVACRLVQSWCYSLCWMYLFADPLRSSHLALVWIWLCSCVGRSDGGVILIPSTAMSLPWILIGVFYTCRGNNTIYTIITRSDIHKIIQYFQQRPASRRSSLDPSVTWQYPTAEMPPSPAVSATWADTR